MIKKGMITLAAGLVAFTAGMAGLYLAMPRLAPERVEATRSLLDSLARSETTHADSLSSDPEPTVLPPAGLPDSLTRTPQSTVAPPTVYADSLRILRARLQETTEARRRLEQELAALRQSQAEARDRQVEAEALGSTIAKLEDRELSALLAQLDMDVLDLIYRASSGRNRTRLLQALAPDRAARFVQDLVRSEAPEAGDAEPPNVQ